MRVVSLIVVVLMMGSMCLRAQNVESTQRVVERLLVQAGDDICAQAGVSAVTYSISAHPDAAWIASMLRDPASQRTCLSRVVDSSASADVVVVCRDIQTTYANAHHQDTVQRRVVVSVDAIDRVHASRVVEVRLVDTALVAREDIALLDSRQHMSTHGTVPSRPTTLWEDITQPIVFIGAAVVTIVLLFTVRSQ